MNEQEKKQLGLRIKECRNKIGFSQEVLAEKLGMKRTNITNYEAGRVVPPGNVLLDMSEVFSVSTDYLLGRTNNPNANTPTTLKMLMRQENADLTNEERDELSDSVEDYLLFRKQRILDRRKGNKED